MKTAVALVTHILLLFTACSPTVEPEPDAPGTMTVTVMTLDTHVTRRGDIENSPDHSDMDVALHIPNGASGYEVRPLNWDGILPIHDVPEGTYYFQLGSMYVAASTPQLDLGSTKLGRPNTVDSKVSPTDLVFDLEGLSPWQEYDEIQVLAPDVGDAYLQADRDLRSSPAVGATRLGDARLDWSGHKLVQGSSAGDRLAIAQIIRTEGSSGWGYRRLERFNEVEVFEQTDGNETHLNGSLAEVALDSSVQLDWRKTQFAAFGADVHPRAEPDYDFLGVSVLPRASQYGFYATSPDLFYSAHAAGAEDLIDTYSFANPYPPSWDKVVVVYSQFTVQYSIGSALPTNLYATLGSDTLLSDVVGKAIRPALSPVTNIRINGGEANIDRTGVTATPSLSWDAPNLGTASGYVVTAFRLADFGGQSEFHSVASFYTDATELQVPPGALDPYGVYVFAIRAVQRPGGSFAESPFRTAFPSAYADAFTDKVAP